MDKTFNFDPREFFGNNNSPKTQRLIESAYKKPRRSRAEDVSLPDLEEYKPQITMADIPRLQSAGKAPQRDEPGEAKGRAIATGVAALLGILSGGDVARSAVAGYTGMKTGQDRIFASEEKSYLTKQKELMDQFNSENKSFGNQLGLERLLQGGVNTRNQQKMGLTGLRMQQARAGDAAEMAGLNLDLRYEDLAQRKSAKTNPMQDPKVNTAVAEYKRLGDALTNPTILKTMTNEQIGVFQKRRDELGKFLGFSGGLGQVTRAGLSDKEKVDEKYRGGSLALRGEQVQIARQRLTEARAKRVLDAKNIESLIKSRETRGGLSDAQGLRLRSGFRQARKLHGEADLWEEQALSDTKLDGSPMDDATRRLYQRQAKNKRDEAIALEEDTKAGLRDARFTNPKSGENFRKPVKLSSGAVVREQRPAPQPKKSGGFNFLNWVGGLLGGKPK